MADIEIAGNKPIVHILRHSRSEQLDRDLLARRVVRTGGDGVSDPQVAAEAVAEAIRAAS